jgi:hypothetical protein
LLLRQDFHKPKKKLAENIRFTYVRELNYHVFNILFIDIYSQGSPVFSTAGDTRMPCGLSLDHTVNETGRINSEQQ